MTCLAKTCSATAFVNALASVVASTGSLASVFAAVIRFRSGNFSS